MAEPKLIAMLNENYQTQCYSVQSNSRRAVTATYESGTLTVQFRKAPVAAGDPTKSGAACHSAQPLRWIIP